MKNRRESIMTRLDRVIQGFNDYDNLIKDITLTEEQEEEIERIRNEVSILIGELKRYGCRRKER
jgi:hypothetical protein